MYCHDCTVALNVCQAVVIIFVVHVQLYLWINLRMQTAGTCDAGRGAVGMMLVRGRDDVDPWGGYNTGLAFKMWGKKFFPAPICTRTGSFTSG